MNGELELGPLEPRQWFRRVLFHQTSFNTSMHPSAEVAALLLIVLSTLSLGAIVVALVSDVLLILSLLIRLCCERSSKISYPSNILDLQQQSQKTGAKPSICMPDSGSALRIKCYRPGTRDSSAFAIAVRPQLPPIGLWCRMPIYKR